MVDQIKNVFISHVNEDDAGLGKLKNLLAKNGMTIKDSSIDSTSPNDASSENYIKSGILAPLINWCGTLLVYVSPETKTSKWVNWEIEYAAMAGKRIVGIWAHGEAECEIPSALSEYADALVGWNSNAIISAINGEDNWTKPDGTIMPKMLIKRHCCS